MLNLNLTFAHEDMISAARGELEESGTSNSSNLNAEGCSSSNVGDDESVSGSGDNCQCFNFDILKVGDASVVNNNNDEDRSEFVTRTLFPVRREEEILNLKLFDDDNNNNNELLEMRSENVQQIKPTVQQSHVVKKSRRGPRSRSSQYRGVTFYRRTGRWESHIWDSGKQVYLGGFDTAHAAARAYDRAAIKFRGVDADINFNISDYEEDMNQIKNLSKEAFVHMLRRHSNGFSRAGSKYRGVTMNNGSLSEARIGQFLGNKAYDNAANKRVVVTNFEANTYEGETIASHYGNGHELDLNLRISTPSCHGNSSSRNKNLEHMQLNPGLQAGNPYTTRLQGIPIISNHSLSWAGIYPHQTIGRPSQGPSNWAWQPYGQSQTPTPLFTAASSGSQPAGNPYTTRLQGIPIISNHSLSWAGIYPHQTIGRPSQGPSNWAWQPYGQSQTPTPLFTAAASSGFPAPVAPNSLNYN